MRRWPLLLVTVLASCATLPPPSIVAVRPAAKTINSVGEWTATAIDGLALRADERFAVTITPDHFRGAACNTIEGGYRLDGHRFIGVGPWRSTERGCFDPTGKRDVMAIETHAFSILASPLNVAMPTTDTLRLHGERGSIDFVRGSPLSRAIVGEWIAVAFDGRPAAIVDRFALSITPTMLRASVCNDVYGHYRLAGAQIEAVGPAWPRTERGCGDPEMRLEDRAWAVLAVTRAPSIAMLTPDRMRITSARGSIDFERRR